MYQAIILSSHPSNHVAGHPLTNKPLSHPSIRHVILVIIYPTDRLNIHSTNQRSIYPAIRQSFLPISSPCRVTTSYPCIKQFIHSDNEPVVHPSSYQSIQPCTHPAIHTSFHFLYNQPSIPPKMKPSIFSSTQLTV